MAKPKILQQLNAETSSQILLKEDPDVAMEAATKQYVDNSGGIFYATYGTTTYAEIVEAFNKGKGVKALYSDTSSYVYIFDLVTRPTGSNLLYFAANNGDIIDGTNLNTAKYYVYINSSNTWGVSNKKYTSTSGTISKSSGTTTLSSSTRYYRPILTSLQAPTSADGQVGDIWIVYNNE